MNKKRVFGIIIVLLGCWLLYQNFIHTSFVSSIAGSGQTSVTYEAKQISNLTIASSSIPVNVKPSSNDDIKLTLTKRGSFKTSLERHVTAHQQGDEMKIQISNNNNTFSWMTSRGLKAELLIPQKLYDQLSVTAKSGNITLSDVNADAITVSTNSGNIKLNEMNVTELSAKANSGNISVDSFTANLIEAATNSGNIKIKHGASAFSIKTSSGNINIDADDITDDSTLHASSGNITVKLSEQPKSLFVSHQKGSGSTKIDHKGFNSSSYNDRAKVVEGQFGDGEIKLNVKTSSGNFKLH